MDGAVARKGLTGASNGVVGWRCGSSWSIVLSWKDLVKETACGGGYIFQDVL